MQLKKSGHAKVHHKPPIADADLKKLYESGVFSSDFPKTLLNKVFFEIMLCFCRRGRQNVRRLRKSDFVVKTDSTGAKFVSRVVDELTKTTERMTRRRKVESCALLEARSALLHLLKSIYTI